MIQGGREGGREGGRAYLDVVVERHGQVIRNQILGRDAEVHRVPVFELLAGREGGRAGGRVRRIEGKVTVEKKVRGLSFFPSFPPSLPPSLPEYFERSSGDVAVSGGRALEEDEIPHLSEGGKEGGREGGISAAAATCMIEREGEEGGREGGRGHDRRGYSYLGGERQDYSTTSTPSPSLPPSFPPSLPT